MKKLITLSILALTLVSCGKHGLAVDLFSEKSDSDSKSRQQVRSQEYIYSNCSRQAYTNNCSYNQYNNYNLRMQGRFFYSTQCHTQYNQCLSGFGMQVNQGQRY